MLFQLSWSIGNLPNFGRVLILNILRNKEKTSITRLVLFGLLYSLLYLVNVWKGFVEHHGILDKEQDGLRRNRGTTQSLIRISHDILTGFNEKPSYFGYLYQYGVERKPPC